MVKEILNHLDNPNFEAISGVDATFLYGETPRSPMHVGSVSVIEGSLQFDTFKKTIESRIHLLPNLRKRLVDFPMNLDYPYWTDDPNFNINLHLEHVALPQPGSWKELRKLASRIFSEPLDKTRPLWKFVFVEGLNEIPQVPKGSVAIISKIHHVAIDGMAGAGMLAILLDMAPNENPPKPPRKWRPKPLPNEVQLLLKSGAKSIKNPFRLPKIIGQTVKSTIKAGVLSRMHRIKPPAAPFAAPHTPINGLISAERKWNTSILSLKRVKAIKNIMGTTLNDVILAICAGALRKYLEEKDQLPAKPMVAMVPVSNRTDKEANEGGNKISAMLVQLATHIDDPIKRLEAIHENAVRGKTYQNALGAKTLSNLAEAVPFGVANQAAKLYTRFDLAKRHRPVFNVVITNVPGPSIPLYLGKHKLLSVMGMAPIIDGVGLIITVLSYNGQITISPTTDQKSMPDLNTFNTYIRESANELEELVLATVEKSKDNDIPDHPESDLLFENMKKHLKKNPTLIKPNSGIYQFNISGTPSGVWTVDLTESVGKFRRSKSKSPDVTFTVKDKHLMEIAKGKIDFATAFIQGRLQVDGDQARALRFAKILSLMPNLVEKN